LLELKRKLWVKRFIQLFGCMVDMALFDLMSKKGLSVPLYKFLGGFRTHIATSIYYWY